MVAWRRLHGGLSSTVHRLTVADRTSATRSVVLKRWIPAIDAQADGMSATAAHEAATLESIARSNIPAPKVIAVTTDARDGRHPAILMTKAAGSVFLTPHDPKAWVGQLAGVLARIHAAGVDAPRWKGWTDPDALIVPPWTNDPALWRAAHVAVRDAAANVAAMDSFLHGDFQHFNVLWSRSCLTSVIDWTFGSRGPCDIDVGHCRLNLAVLFSPDLAEEFLAAYESEAGRRVDPGWDLRALMSYDQDWKRFIPIQVAGRAPVDADGMDARIEHTVRAAVRRL